ncbi:hypothetical protein SAMN06265338_101284 [Rhodoblastus acidophilus]|uniref:Uncharacterized protein n=1 Tax=Rhodoblastus acidophilus TaxID=1074 RepID=A0A212Q036_RHOAC|nr:hypothetical protein SAMN06265338_101284 [Rhodoblastus acidophilus]
MTNPSAAARMEFLSVCAALAFMAGVLIAVW